MKEDKPCEHENCYKNYEGSSTGMDTHMAVTGV